MSPTAYSPRILVYSHHWRKNKFYKSYKSYKIYKTYQTYKTYNKEATHQLK